MSPTFFQNFRNTFWIFSKCFHNSLKLFSNFLQNFPKIFEISLKFSFVSGSRTRTFCENLTDEEEDLRRIREFFSPSYEKDFENSDELLDKDKEKVAAKKLNLFISEEEMIAIYTIHSQLAKNFTFTDWMVSHPESEEASRLRIVNSFGERCNIFAALLDQYNGALSESLDVICIPTVLLMADVNQKFLQKDQCPDFYHTSDAEEVSIFYPVLIRIRKHAEELLEQWDNNPVLSSVSASYQ